MCRRNTRSSIMTEHPIDTCLSNWILASLEAVVACRLFPRSSCRPLGFRSPVGQMSIGETAFNLQKARGNGQETSNDNDAFDDTFKACSDSGGNACHYSFASAPTSSMYFDLPFLRFKTLREVLLSQAPLDLSTPWSIQILVLLHTRSCIPGKCTAAVPSLALSRQKDAPCSQGSNEEEITTQVNLGGDGRDLGVSAYVGFTTLTGSACGSSQFKVLPHGQQVLLLERWTLSFDPYVSQTYTAIGQNENTCTAALKGLLAALYSLPVHSSLVAMNKSKQVPHSAATFDRPDCQPGVEVQIIIQSKRLSGTSCAATSPTVITYLSALNDTLECTCAVHGNSRRDLPRFQRRGSAPDSGLAHEREHTALRSSDAVTNGGHPLRTPQDRVSRRSLDQGGKNIAVPDVQRRGAVHPTAWDMKGVAVENSSGNGAPADDGDVHRICVVESSSCLSPSATESLLEELAHQDIVTRTASVLSTHMGTLKYIVQYDRNIDKKTAHATNIYGLLAGGAEESLKERSPSSGAAVTTRTGRATASTQAAGGRFQGRYIVAAHGSSNFSEAESGTAHCGPLPGFLRAANYSPLAPSSSRAARAKSTMFASRRLQACRTTRRDCVPHFDLVESASESCNNVMLSSSRISSSGIPDAPSSLSCCGGKFSCLADSGRAARCGLCARMCGPGFVAKFSVQSIGDFQEEADDVEALRLAQAEFCGLWLDSPRVASPFNPQRAGECGGLTDAVCSQSITISSLEGLLKDRLLSDDYEILICYKYVLDSLNALQGVTKRVERLLGCDERICSRLAQACAGESVGDFADDMVIGQQIPRGSSTQRPQWREICTAAALKAASRIEALWMDALHTMQLIPIQGDSAPDENFHDSQGDSVNDAFLFSKELQDTLLLLGSTTATKSQKSCSVAIGPSSALQAQIGTRLSVARCGSSCTYPSSTLVTEVNGLRSILEFYEALEETNMPLSFMGLS